MIDDGLTLSDFGNSQVKRQDMDLVMTHVVFYLLEIYKLYLQFAQEVYGMGDGLYHYISRYLFFSVLNRRRRGDCFRILPRRRQTLVGTYLKGFELFFL